MTTDLSKSGKHMGKALGEDKRVEELQNFNNLWQKIQYVAAQHERATEGKRAIEGAQVTAVAKIQKSQSRVFG